MSLNTAHANNGVLIHAGECILLFSDNVSMDFDNTATPILKGGTKQGRIYLTTHRMIFNSKKAADALQSFSFPFVALNNVKVEQPVFGANYIRGTVQAQDNGNWSGTATFKLVFKHGGAIDFAQAMLRAVQMARRQYQNSAPPPYVPPSGDWYAAPPPAYSPSPQGYYGWVPSTQAFPNQPPPNSVYMHDMPPPYPGIVAPQPAPMPQQPPYGGGGWMPNGAQGGGGYPQQPQQYPPGPQPPAGHMHPNPMPMGAMGFATGPAPTGGGGYGYPSAPAGPSSSAAAAANNAKSQEAAQSAYYDPNQPQTAFVPPPAYYEQPPSYDSLKK